jgi:hypothetical protein
MKVSGTGLRARAASIARGIQGVGYALLVLAAALAVLAGLVLATGHPRAHTLMVYAAVASATFGVAFTLPFALRTNPLAPEEDS